MVKGRTSWEKTVEWAFVRSYLPPEIVAAPLAGNIELSDAIVGLDSQWLLIEFKRSSDVCKLEADKYPRWNPSLTAVIAGREYKKYINSFENFTSQRTGDWWASVLDTEDKLLRSLFPDDKRPPGVFKEAGAELGSLLADFRKIDWALPQAKKEPHYFVFPENEKWVELNALPYWSDCFSVTPGMSRGVSPFSARDIWKGAVDYAEFTEYAVRLARARGYPDGAIVDAVNLSSTPAEPLVFGFVVGHAIGDKGQCIVMTLREFYASNPNLIKALEQRRHKHRP